MEITRTVYAAELEVLIHAGGEGDGQLAIKPLLSGEGAGWKLFQQWNHLHTDGFKALGLLRLPF